MKTRVTVWIESSTKNRVEKAEETYPDGIYTAFNSFPDSTWEFEVSTAAFDEPEYGLADEVFENTDDLIKI